MTSRICVARIGAAHGVRGEVKLWPFTEEPLAVAEYGPLETEDGKREFEIESVRAAKDHLVARLKGVADRDAAQTLTQYRSLRPARPAAADSRKTTRSITPTWSGSTSWTRTARRSAPSRAA